MDKIKNKFIYALAPMAGVTDFAFRKICADFGKFEQNETSFGVYYGQKNEFG